LQLKTKPAGYLLSFEQDLGIRFPITPLMYTVADLQSNAASMELLAERAAFPWAGLNMPSALPPLVIPGSVFSRPETAAKRVRACRF
jgi:hypothetical protein